MNDGADLLNAVIAEVAGEYGFQFVDVTQRFIDHGVNAAEPWILGDRHGPLPPQPRRVPGLRRGAHLIGEPPRPSLAGPRAGEGSAVAADTTSHYSASSTSQGCLKPPSRTHSRERAVEPLLMSCLHAHGATGRA